MAEAPRIRGMAWDHPRARDPLAAVTTEWLQGRPIRVEWDARPLKDFEDQPLEELANRYDLVLVDYPFTGFAAESGLLEPVDAWASPDYIDDQRRNSVGPSFASYTWGGRQWALAIDAACQVSAVRPDLWRGGWGAAPPGDWDSVAALAARLKGAPAQLALPLNPNHAYCAFISVGIGLAGKAFWPVGNRFDRAAAEEALAFLRGLCRDLHPASQAADPIAISDLMSETDQVACVPLMFGYSNYARPGFRPHRLRFGEAPFGAQGTRGSVLGGAGIALSARSGQPQLAADLARYLASPAVQAGLYVDAGGQPGHAAAWDSASANRLVDGYFRATRATMEQAFVRPRVAGHRQFQRLAGERIHRCLWAGDTSVPACLDSLDWLYDIHLGDWGEQAGGALRCATPRTLATEEEST